MPFPPSPAHVLAHDWSQTSLGPIETWPASLRGYVSMVMEMPTPAIIFWGAEQVQIYNAGYAVIMGPRHPRYFGGTYRECWPETYAVINPWMQEVLRGGFKQVHDTMITLTRHGFAEEAYFTFTLSPLRDDRGQIAGVFQPVTEVTEAVLAERRARTVRQLDVDLPAALAANLRDLPFSLVFQRADQAAGGAQPAGGAPRGITLVAQAGFEQPLTVDARARIDQCVAQVIATLTPLAIDDVAGLLGHDHLGPWAEPTRAAVLVPLIRGADEPIGAALFGISPRLAFDAAYQAFFDAVARELASSFSAERASRVELDLHAREQAARREAELQKEHLVSLFTQAPMPIVVLRGPEMIVELANPSTCELWRRSHAEVIARPLFEALPELRGQVFEELLVRVYETGVPYVGEAVPAHTGRVERGPLHESFLTFVYAPLRNLEGAVDGILVIAADVTEQIRARQQVDALRVAAEAANDAKDQFLAVLGHELRNPLAPILTAIELMKLGGEEQRARNLDVIERQTVHMVRLVGDLLDLSRITRGKVELTRQRIEVGELIATAVEMTQPLLSQRRHQLIVDVPRTGHVVEVDPGRVAQAITNVLANAAKYTPAGGQIFATATGTETEVVVRIRDTGIGIHPEVLPQIFERFVQAPQAIDRTQGGLGLGLAIVKSLITMHGGSVEAHSEGQGHGTELVIHLPRAAPHPTAAGADGPAAAPPASSLPTEQARRVLVVDDNEDAAELLAMLLDRMGFDTRVAHDGATALAIASEFQPEIGVLDLGLPGMDGFELAQRLRDQHQAVRLVAVTGYGQDSDRRRTQAVGFDAHLVKPVSTDELRTIIAKVAPPELR